MKVAPCWRRLYDRIDLWLTPILTDLVLDAYDWISGRK